MKKLFLLVSLLGSVFTLIACMDSKTDLDYINEIGTFVLGFTDFLQ